MKKFGITYEITTVHREYIEAETITHALEKVWSMYGKQVLVTDFWDVEEKNDTN